MLTKFKIGTLLLAVALFVASCANETENNARETALQSIQPTATTQPTQPVASQPAQPTAPQGPTTTMSFAEMKHDFGTVQEGEKVRHVYKFTNTGNEPLIISNARGSCGCTVPDWPQDPIAPGAESEIIVQFDSKGKPGRQTKTVTITANTEPSTTKLTITGNVEKSADAPAQSVQVVQ